MLNLVSSLLQIETLITVLVGLAAFATILTIAAPYFETDQLATRMKSVGQERDKLRAAQRVQLMASPETRLREKPKTSLYSQLVDALNLRRVFDAEASREMLRQAGMRNERQSDDLSCRPADRAAGAGDCRVHLFVDGFRRPRRALDARGGHRHRSDLRLLSAHDFSQEHDFAAPILDQARLVRCPRSAAHLRGIRHGDRARLAESGARDRQRLGAAGRGTDPYRRRTLLSAGPPQGIRQSRQTHRSDDGEIGRHQP